MTQTLESTTHQDNLSPYGIITLDDTLQITTVDHSFQQMFGFQQGNLIGVVLESLFNENDRKAVTDFHRKISSYQSGFIELAIELHINKHDYYVLMRMVRHKQQWTVWVENLQGSNAGIIGNLICNQDRYASVLKNSADGVILLNAGNEIIEFNKSFFDIVSIHNSQGILINEAALTGSNFFQQVDDVFNEIQAVINTARQKKRAQLNHPLEYQNYFLLLDITPIFQPVLGYIGCSIVMHDQTATANLEKRAQELAENEIRLVKEQESERLELEFQLRQAQKMEAIGQLTGGIAHDFNNLLTSVLGNAELALEIAHQQANRLLQKYLTNLLHSGQRARDLISQMLVFSRGQRGEFKISELNQVVYEAVKLMQLSLPSSVVIHTHIEDHDSLVKHDVLQIEQVLMNLCMNAHDAVDGVGSINISLSKKQFSDEICSACSHRFKGDYVALSITDNGCGIEQSVIERMFEPFYSTKEVGKGSGMGLSMAHGIIHEHHGHILVKSSQGQGTAITLVLPIAPQQATASTQNKHKPAYTSRIQKLQGSVLLVDDEPLVTEFMQDLMQSRGLDVTATTSSRNALELFKNNPGDYNLIITDQTMPDMTGMQLAQQLLKIQSGLNIILYTGHSEKLSELQVRQQGIKAYLKKPVDSKALLETIQQLLPG